ncbi:uncharacterized protein C3orf38 homolog [Bactrocera neohumeralis]|uniref:uncharacterized protein C3orf38 homolog n=1 Tax=Bactrocera neohumeralis TaxID=98809 RepID=UPI0021666CD2|nr:uncharacterized protein C3orf38 homolog [Bactrocera neohumeralis]XP_050335727.1 uncharacterized protein C3orf38 homolog [Bactrocera neohumeralis]
MPITEREKLGIVDFLVSEEQNVPALLQVARSVTKNICDVATAQEALDYAYIQIGDTLTLLNKRAITREMLFKYLHHRKIQVNADFTKGALITKIIEYWNTFQTKNEHITHNNDSVHNQTTSSQEKSFFSQVDSTVNDCNNKEAPYPIHLLARKFTEWFFNNLNTKELKVEDFWTDATLQLRIAATDQINDYEAAGDSEVISNLLKSKEQFGFFFNPNLTHAGVQGRMNVHGLVLVLACGTLHTEQNCVGVFECTFGLLRDPFAENNWKVKTMQCILRSQIAASMPSLCESETLKEALCLPIPEGEIT